MDSASLKNTKTLTLKFRIGFIHNTDNGPHLFSPNLLWLNSIGLPIMYSAEKLKS